MANSALTVANTNFNDIKASLKTFLKSQSEFQDFNFEGSNLNVLLDVLSYNTFFQNFYLNQVASESFLDSAQLRDSIVSHAKTLNYLPKSDTSAKATVDIEVTPANTPANLIVDKHHKFTASFESNSFTFSTNKGFTISQDANGAYIAEDIDIFEGEIVKELFTVDTSNNAQRFVLSNEEIDKKIIELVGGAATNAAAGRGF